ncbi:MAG: sigma-70 family RNA polymerase sigma factor [Nitrospirota bacterium]
MDKKVLKDINAEIAELITKGEEKGYITYDEINEIFTEDAAWSPHLEDFFTKLEEKNIEIHDNGKMSQMITDEDMRFKKSNDPINTYLKEINQISLLTPVEERRFARQVEIDHLRIKEIEIKTGLSQRRLKQIYEKWKLKEIKKKDLPLSLKKLPKKEIDKLLHTIEILENKIESVNRRFIEANLRLVVNVAKRYGHGKLSFLDLINEGNLGLIRAVSKYDYKEGFKFSTYAIWWIKQAITRAIADQGRIIRVPVYMMETVNRCIKTINTLSQQLSREPTLEEIATKMKMPVAKVIELINIAQEPISLETPVGINGESELGDLIEDKAALPQSKAIFFSMLQEQIHEIVDTLPEKERLTLKLRFGLDGLEPHTLDEVGKILGITRERVRQMEKKILDKLRKMRITKQLHDFLVEE